MDNSGNRDGDSFAQGESFRASKNQYFERTSGTTYCRSGFLHDKDPASLLVLSFIALVFAALASYLSIKFISGSEGIGRSIVNYREVQITTRSGSTLISTLFGIIAFLLGIIGGLLPIWAVGRLIADAIRDGAKS